MYEYVMVITYLDYHTNPYWIWQLILCMISMFSRLDCGIPSTQESPRSESPRSEARARRRDSAPGILLPRFFKVPRCTLHRGTSEEDEFRDFGVIEGLFLPGNYISSPRVIALLSC